MKGGKDSTTMWRAPGARVALIVAPYYTEIAAGLVEGARAALEAGGAQVEIVEVPGALEIAPAIATIETVAHGGGLPSFDGYVALGCVIRGETSHYDLVCGESARGLTILGVERGLAVGNGILTVENYAQAQERADPARLNKGGEAAAACLALIALRHARARA